METGVQIKTIKLKENVLSTIVLSIGQNICAIDAILKMNDEQMLEYMLQLEQFDFVKDLLKQKSVNDLIQDLEIKDLINKNKRGIETHYEELVEAYDILVKSSEEK